MPLINASKTELSDLFKPFFEDCPQDVEDRLAIPFDKTLPQFTSTVYPHLQADASFGLDPQTRLLNLDYATYTELCNTIAQDFFAHTRFPSDYDIKSVHVLRNPLVWARYQAEKQLRRRLAKERRARENPLHPHAQPPSAANEEDPEELYRDEILYHGTHKTRVPSILMNGLEPRMTIRANYGQGVYFSDSIEKCMQYVDYQTSLDQEYSIILCCVLLGRVMVEPHEKAKRNMNPQIKFLPPSFDSAVEHDVYKEWVVIEKSQILPLCVINFKTSNQAECYHRLGSVSSLFRGTNHYPTSIHDIQKTCSVLTPFDNNAQSSISLREQAEQLRDPDTELADMLSNVFYIPINTAKFCNLILGGFREWLFIAPDSTGTKVWFYVTEAEKDQLISASKNIQTLKTRMDEEVLRAEEARKMQQHNIEAEIKLIPRGAELVVLLTDKLPEIDQVTAEGRELEVHIQHMTAQAVQAGGHQAVMSQQFLNARHPHDAKLKELQFKYEALQALFTSWTEHQFGMGKRVVAELRPALERAVQVDAARVERQTAAIAAERERTHRQGMMIIKTLTEQDAQQRWERSKQERLVAQRFGIREDFAMKTVEVETSRARSWPLIVAELLMPVLMISQVRMETTKHLSDTTWVNQHIRIRDLCLQHAKVWWDVTPEIVFGGPTPHHQLWPFDPRRRLPNNALFSFNQYFEWIFLERESRVRRFNQRHNTRGSAATGSSTDPLEGLDRATFLQEQWEHIDPTIVRAVANLSSRFGTVYFNREARQAELDQMGTDHVHRGATHALTGWRKQWFLFWTGGGDELVIPGTNAVSTTATPEKVVKLKSCRHCYHDTCIREWFKSKDAQLKCPMCNIMCTTGAKADATKNVFRGQRAQKLGPQPDGILGYNFDVRLCCYFIYIVMPSHTVSEPTATNPNATRMVPTDIRYAIVPFTSRLGPLLMIRILTLFYYGHLFKVGQSLTRGVNNVVVWNGVHLRTSMSGQYGFPAPNWESNCWQEINQKGVAMGLDELVLSVPAADGRISRTAQALNSQALGAGVAIPEALAAEIAAQELSQRLFHQDQPSLFLL
ncbi:hypothetical protein BGX23_009578 [Mortierella sp. AD031]|nr:hypothetical protein BGX23_009578 [Mortierella sp. AD031]